MFPICAVFVVFYGDTYASLANHLVHEVHSNNISLYGGDSHNTNSFVHCAGEAVEYLQQGNHYVALSQEKSEEIWRKRTCGSGGGGLGVGISGVSPSPVEEFPNLQDLISLEHPDVPSFWDSADLPEESATKTVTIPDPSAITVMLLKNIVLPYPDLPWLLLLNRYLHLALPRVMQLRLHPRILLNARM